eukprot:TRINITY_DN2198_c2_g1_i2.p2 TRINITY_DN2198_c2_g1~~TRINITY_DN2198_c2_g1_i2.p2  ORF type:complete len:148 (-),score=22.27 TRINITY_DN2198_c2_g1_i2:277-720(-)
MSSSGSQIFQMFITNKSGSLIYGKEFVDGVVPSGSNDAIYLASAWHTMNGIATQLSPVPGCMGLEVLEAETFHLHCYQTLTGTKFLLLAHPEAKAITALLQKVYELYADYVMKNPFFSPDGQAVKHTCALFDKKVEQLVAEYNTVPL